VARFRERAFIAGALAAPLLLFFAPSEVSFAVGGVLTAALMFWLLRGRTLALHGAEHRAIAAAERRELVSTWEGEARPSRFSPRCGTNFAALAMPVTFALDRWLPLAPTAWTPVAVTVLSLALTMELWQFVQRGSRAGRLFLVPGLALQRLTTREPALEETQVALRAVASVLQRELPS
jgi:uncharacterized protein YqhQ